jgi:hypothetical protein
MSNFRVQLQPMLLTAHGPNMLHYKQAYVDGPGEIIPSSLVTITYGLEYTFVVALSTTDLTGKVSIRMQRSTPPICRDPAGNGFLRNASSVIIVRFGTYFSSTITPHRCN